MINIVGKMARRFTAVALALLAACGGGGGGDTSSTPVATGGTLDPIKNVVVIYLENHSFDNLYGEFPGANGIANALANPASYRQLDRDGVTVLSSLPAAWSAGGASTWSFVAGLPNKPFRIDAPNGSSPGVPLSTPTPDIVHRYYENQMQINGGANNMFAAWSDGGGLPLGYYDGTPMRLWNLARQYTLADNFFQGAFGGSFLNHFWFVCACTPVWPGAPASIVSSVDSSGTRLNLAANSPKSALTGLPLYVGSGSTTPKLSDGNFYAVNTSAPPFQPSNNPSPAGVDARLADPATALPPQSARTIGDTLTAKGVDWKWYAGAWNLANADRSAIGTQYVTHHHPFNYFSRFDPTTASGAAERAAHMKDYADLQADIQKGSLPPVAFYKPKGDLNQHPGNNLMLGDAHVADLVASLQSGPQWKDMMIVITYDESGGFWDHVSPPAGERWGPGPRVPAIVISPYAKKGFVDSTRYDTTSIIKFLTRRFGLEPIAGVRAGAGDLTNTLTLPP